MHSFLFSRPVSASRPSGIAFALAAVLHLASVSLLRAQDNPVPSDAYSSPFGITSSGSSYRTDSEWFPKMSAAGIYWARMFPEWSGLEPAAGQWHFDDADAMLQSAANNHIEVSGLFFGSPSWVDPRIHAFPMSHLDAWSNYAAKLVDRYRTRIHYWEVWNEGNGGINDGKNNTSDYATLVAYAYEAAKRVDPNAQVGMSVASVDAPYLNQAILAQAKMGKPENFDYLCYHPYEVIGGLSEADGEIPYLWITRLTRDMLKADAPDRANAEIWFTEVGRPLGGKKESKETDFVSESVAAKTLAKAYLMAIAEGVHRICWFEAQDPVREPPGYGVLNQDGTPRPSYTALKTMTAQLGPAPKNLGWLALGAGGKGYGFVFQGKSAPVLAAWMPFGEKDKTLTFSSPVSVIRLLDNTTVRFKAGQPLTLTDSPVLILGLPADLLARAHDNAGKNFPWGGDFSHSTVATIGLGAPNRNQGVIQVERNWTQPHQFEDGSTGAIVSPPGKHDSQNIKFIVHPSFANLMTHEYYVRVTARRLTSGQDATHFCGMNLVYERADTQGKWPMSTAEWFGLADEPGQWQSYTWHLTDACFSKLWDYDIAFSIGKSDPFVIGKVEVSTQPFVN